MIKKIQMMIRKRIVKRSKKIRNKTIKLQIQFPLLLLQINLMKKLKTKLSLTKKILINKTVIKGSSIKLPQTASRIKKGLNKTTIKQLMKTSLQISKLNPQTND